ncbi:hypothetical protein D9M71_518060 [compost metagenome]
MDEAIADHTDGGGAEGADDDRHLQRHGGGDAVDRLARQDDVGDEEADIDDGGEEHDQQRAVAAELAAALDHLRDAHLRPLGRGQGDEDAAEHMPQRDGQQAPEQVEVEHLDHHGPGDDGQRRDIGAEPEREQVARPAVALGWRHVVDGMVLDQRLLGILGHRLALLVVFVGKPLSGALVALRRAPYYGIPIFRQGSSVQSRAEKAHQARAKAPSPASTKPRRYWLVARLPSFVGENSGAGK